MRQKVEIIKDYVQYSSGQFSALQVSDLTGIALKTVQNTLRELEIQNQITSYYREKKVKFYTKKAKVVVLGNKPSVLLIEQVKTYINSNLKHHEIAELLGVSRSSVSMAFRVLKEQGFEVKRQKPVSKNELRSELHTVAEQSGEKICLPICYMNKKELKDEINRHKAIIERKSNELHG